MSDARKDFVGRIVAFKGAINEPALISKSPEEVAHNSTARLLRNGLAVVCFSMLEDFIKRRLQEVLARIGDANIPFDDLPQGLREAAVYGTLRAALYHGDLRRRQGEDYISFIQEHGNHIGSTSTASYVISGLALGWDRPNLTSSDVKDILRVFHVKDGWRNIERLATRVGLASPSLNEAFRQLASRRHRAAHAADADTEIAHLQAFVPQAIAIAVGFDALISRCLRRFLDRDTTYLSEDGELSSEDISIRYIDQNNGFWREVREGSEKAVKRDENLDTLTAACLARPNSRDDLVVVRDLSQRPVNWYIQNVA